jgi:peptidoglycan/LPS O-acetylase OafA/YrhL
VFLHLHGILAYASLAASVILACLFASAFYGVIERRVLERIAPPEKRAPELVKAAA